MLWCFLSALRKQDCPGYQLNNTTFLSWFHALLDPSSLAHWWHPKQRTSTTEVICLCSPRSLQSSSQQMSIRDSRECKQSKDFQKQVISRQLYPTCLSSRSANTITHNQEWWPLPEHAQQEDPWFNYPSTAPSVLRKQLPTLDCILHKNCPAQKWAKQWRCLPSVFKSLRNRCCHWW